MHNKFLLSLTSSLLIVTSFSASSAVRDPYYDEDPVRQARQVRWLDEHHTDPTLERNKAGVLQPTTKGINVITEEGLPLAFGSSTVQENRNW